MAITITDFREKLIPHEITYPAILLGIIYSATIRHDLLGTLAGVGASYLIFDFIDHFGIKFYYFLHPEFRDRHKIEDESALDDQIDFDMEVGYLHADEEDEPFMVMGGGDAVLSALIAAWLGWERLIPALVIGFLVGAVMGGIYLLVELKKEKMLSGALKSFSLWFGGFAGAMALGIYGLSFNFPQASLWNNPVTYLLIFALGFGGGTLGIMSAPGPRLVKHFPFGPALAVGALCSIFLIVGSGESFIKPY
ncbi:MAG: prepilin peptidase [Candidatus Obscuribacter sp.]|nr:prepilin peptidase [Candidatus Obscuribacter sp.]